MSQADGADEHIDANLRSISRSSMKYLISVVGEIVGKTGLDVLDIMIVCTVANTGTQHLIGDRAFASRHGAASTPAPDSARRPVSRNAIAQSLHVPTETVRRRIAALVERGILKTVGRNGVMVDALSPTNFTADVELARTNARLLRRMLAELRVLDVDLGPRAAT